MLRLGRRLGIALGGGAASWLGAAGYVALNDFFDAGDLTSFAFWCAVFALYLWATWAAAASLVAIRTGKARVAWSAFLGGVAGAVFFVAMVFGMGPWILGYGFPVALLLIGGGVLAFSGSALAEPRAPTIGLRRSVLRLVASMAPFVLLPIGLTLGDAFLWGRAVHTRYVLPPGFLGPVVIVYDVDGAEPLPRDDAGYRVVVPSSGVVLTSTPPNPGWRNPEVMYERDGDFVTVVTDWPGQDDKLRGVRAYWLSRRGRATLNGVPQPYMEYETFAVAESARDPDVRRRNDEVVDSLWALYAR